VGTIARGLGGRLVALKVGSIRKLAGRMKALLPAGVERWRVAMAGKIAAKTIQQASPPQCMGRLASWRDWPQSMPVGIAVMDLAGGQHAMVGCVPQAF